MIARKSLAFKLGIVILAATTAIFAAAFGYSYYVSKKTVLAGVISNMDLTTDATINSISSVLTSVEHMPAYLARMLEHGNLSKSALNSTLADMIAANQNVFGTTAAFEPFEFSSALKYYAPYACKAPEGVRFSLLDPPAYDYPKWEWYAKPRELNRPLWSEPYFDEGGGNVLMCTYSVPFYRQKAGKPVFAGVVTADISLDWLVKMVSSISVLKTGYAFLVSEKGVFLTFPDKSFVMHKTLTQVVKESGDATLEATAAEMLRGKEGFARARLGGRPVWIYYQPLAATGWSLAVVAPEDELFAELRKLTREVFVIGVVGFGFLFAAVFFLSSRAVRPIRALAARSVEIAKGNLDAGVPVIDSGDEVGELSHSFEDMRLALKEYIANLASTTAAKERLESELKIARSIQMSFLPKRFPDLAQDKPFRLDALLEPAKMVGGDFYDFFLPDEDRLFFSVGDVSDKGVPAALFMAVTKTLMKGITVPGMEPAEILARVNRELAKENDMYMFVTLFCGIIDFRTGIMEYSNAGHLPPLLTRRGGTPEFLEMPPGTPLGLDEAARYQTRRVTLAAGDCLFLYTDGITESANPGGEFYGEERLQSVLAALRGAEPQDMVKAVFESAQKFSAGAPQFDDMTALAVCYGCAESGQRRGA